MYPADLAGKGFGDFLLAGDIPRAIRDFGALLADGTLASLSANAVPIRMGGEVTGVVSAKSTFQFFRMTCETP